MCACKHACSTLTLALTLTLSLSLVLFLRVIADGVLYTWGKGTKGVLGLDSEANVATPTAVKKGLEGAKVRLVNAG